MQAASSLPSRQPLHEQIAARQLSTSIGFESMAQVAELLKNPDLPDAQRLALARLAARHWPAQLLEHASELGIAEEQNRLNLALSVLGHPAVDAGSLDLPQVARAFGLQSDRSLARLLVPLVERQGMEPAQALKGLGLLHRRDFDLTSAMWNFPLDGQTASAVVGKALLQARGDDASVVPGIVALVKHKRLAMQERVELARALATRSDSESLAVALMGMGSEFADAATRRELALTVAGSAPFGEGFDRFARYSGDPLGMTLKQQEFVLANLSGDPLKPGDVGQAIRHLCDAEGEHLSLEERTAAYAHGVSLLASRHEQVGLPWADLHAVLYRQYEEGAVKNRLADVAPFDRLRPVGQEPQHEWDFGKWHTAASFALHSLDDGARAALTPAIEWLSKVRPPELRMSLTRTLSTSVHLHGVGAFLGFAASSDFRRTHMHGFAMLTYRLYADEPDGLPPALARLLSDSRLKDGRKMRMALQSLQVIAESPSMTAAERRRLMDLAVPGPDEPGGVDAFLATLKRLAIVMDAIDKGGEGMARVRESLAGVQSGEQLATVLPELLVRVAPGTPKEDLSKAEMDRLVGRWDRFMSESRQPDALIAYAQLLRGEGDEELEGVSELVDRFADAVIWADDPREAFTRLRYDVAASEHLAHIAETAPAAWQAWRTALPAHAGAAGPGFADSDEAEDLLLCGTEVAGSCQHVAGDADNNKALMGYVADGKYRILLARNERGEIQARRLLRLLVDGQTGQPVLHIERLYARAGIDEGGEVDAGLLEMAVEKAGALGCPLLCHGNEDAGGEHWAGVAVSLSSRAPFEYVDGGGLHVTDGDYELDSLYRLA